MADETTNEIWFGLDGRQITESSADSGIYTVKNASCVKNTETIIRCRLNSPLRAEEKIHIEPNLIAVADSHTALILKNGSMR